MITLRIVIVVLMLLVVPFGYGALLSARYKNFDHSDYLSIYLYGLCFYYALFSCITVPMTIFRRPFHEVKTLGLILVGAASIFFLYYVFVKKGMSVLFQWMHNSMHIVRKYWWFLFPACIIAFQIIRSVLRMNSVYSDDDTYIPMIMDMLKTDQILGTNPITGELHNYYTYANHKFVLTSWLQFLAMLSAVSGIHPLFLIKTVLPVFFISWHYFVIWKITRFMFSDYLKRIEILFFYTLLMEFGSPSLNTDLSYYLFTWNWYGKAVLQFYLIPMVILFFLMIQNTQTGWREGLILMVLIITGLGLSTMGLILLSIIIVVFVVLECIEKHSVREQWVMVPAFLPIIIDALLFFTMF